MLDSLVSQEMFAVPDETIERLRSLLDHARDQEKAGPFLVEDPHYADSTNEIEHLRSLLAHAHDAEVSPFRKFVSHFIGNRKDAA